MVNPAEVQNYLSGVDYPATKQDIMQAAQDGDAPDDVISAINMLPDQEFDSPTDVTRAISNMQNM